jgi:hypothetical protein
MIPEGLGRRSCARVVLSTGPYSRFDAGAGSEHELDRCNWFPPITRHFQCKTLAPIKYLSFDRIVPRSVSRFCSFSRSFHSCSRICDCANIRWVAIENPQFLTIISPSFTAIQRILVQLQIWQREANDEQKLHILHIDHVMIRSEPKYLIAAKVAVTVRWNCSPVSTCP